MTWHDNHDMATLSAAVKVPRQGLKVPYAAERDPPLHPSGSPRVGAWHPTGPFSPTPARLPGRLPSPVHRCRIAGRKRAIYIAVWGKEGNIRQ